MQEQAILIVVVLLLLLRRWGQSAQPRSRGKHGAANGVSADDGHETSSGRNITGVDSAALIATAFWYLLGRHITSGSGMALLRQSHGDLCEKIV
ncbi:uncharacterized protein UTRI_02276 [Ustilago trichophora]|uniref:Secreted protein n=1 Tax=Ustilago trichophora TaxID=86804 RepID=A0A5C3E647_9BASI|nr:uncharacterized protein UTRI_02276 [Ustilago trichophora]